MNIFLVHYPYKEPWIKDYANILLPANTFRKYRLTKRNIKKTLGCRKLFLDSGAFYYTKKDQKVPYGQEYVCNLAAKINADFVASLDIPMEFIPFYKKEHYRQVSLGNAERLLKISDHLYCGHPVGVAQGWNFETYKDSILKLLDMGYSYIGLGSVCRASTEFVFSVVFLALCLISPKRALSIFQNPKKHFEKSNLPGPRYKKHHCTRQDQTPGGAKKYAATFDGVKHILKSFFGEKNLLETVNSLSKVGKKAKIHVFGQGPRHIPMLRAMLQRSDSLDSASMMVSAVYYRDNYNNKVQGSRKEIYKKNLKEVLNT